MNYTGNVIDCREHSVQMIKVADFDEKLEVRSFVGSLTQMGLCDIYIAGSHDLGDFRQLPGLVIRND